MKYMGFIFISLFSFLFLIGCQEQAVAPLLEAQHQGQNSADGLSFEGFLAKESMNYRAHLKGYNEVPPVETDAQGEAIFKFSSDGNYLHYKLIVANIYNVRASHIHWAPAGQNGGVVAFLFPGPKKEGRFDGVLAEGTITATDLRGALAGQTLADLKAEMLAGRTYVNVHTDAVPSGEIRGQIR